MADGRKNNGGKREGAGNIGYGKLSFIMKNAKKVLPTWWTEIAKMMKGKDPTDKRFAMAELNKIQVKMIPQTLANDPNNPLPNIGVIILPQKDANTLETNPKAK